MTYEEFQAGLAETPELINEIFDKYEGDYTKHLTEKKQMIVTTKDAYAKDREDAIGQGTKKAHSEWEEKFEKVTGQKKPDGKKGLVWFDELSSRIKFLNEDGGDTNAAIIKGLQKELEEVKTSLSKKDKEALQARINGEVNTALKGLTFATPSHLKKDTEKTAFQRQKAEDAADIFNVRYTTSIDDQGRIVFTNKKGEAQTENGQPMTAEAIAARDFANDLVPKGRKAAGAGSGEDDDQQQQGGADYLGATTEEIRKKIAEMGHAVGTNKWSELYSKAHIAAGYVKENGQFFKK